jgi:hypothetical protein
MASCFHALPFFFILLAWKREKFEFGFGKKIVIWMQSFYKFNPIFHNSRPLIINSPSQNEIVGWFLGRVHSLAVRLFPVCTPSKTHTSAIDLCGVQGLVSVHWPNLFEKRQEFHMTRPFQWTATTIYRHPSVEWTSGQTFRPFFPGHICYRILKEIKKKG